WPAGPPVLQRTRPWPRGGRGDRGTVGRALLPCARPDRRRAWPGPGHRPARGGAPWRPTAAGQPSPGWLRGHPGAAAGHGSLLIGPDALAVDRPRGGVGGLGGVVTEALV